MSEVRKKLLISYWLTIRNASLVESNEKAIGSVRSLAIILKSKFLCSTDAMYRKLKRLEEEGYGKKQQKKPEIDNLIDSICKELQVSRTDLIKELAADESD